MALATQRSLTKKFAGMVSDRPKKSPYGDTQLKKVTESEATLTARKVWGIRGMGEKSVALVFGNCRARLGVP